MNEPLKRINKTDKHFIIKDGRKIFGTRKTKSLYDNQDGLTGDSSKMFGDKTGLHGYAGDKRGDVTWITGNCSNIYGLFDELIGDVTLIRGKISNINGVIHNKLYGDITSIEGSITGLGGCATGIKGNLDLITSEDRKREPDINKYVFMPHPF